MISILAVPRIDSNKIISFTLDLGWVYKFSVHLFYYSSYIESNKQKIEKSLLCASDYCKKPETDLNLHTLQSKGNDFITVNPRYQGLKSIF